MRVTDAVPYFCHPPWHAGTSTASLAINEIYAVTKWVAEHGDQINVDGKNLALVGNSVGGIS